MPDEKRESQFAEEKLTSRMARIIKRDWKTIPNCMSYFRIVLISEKHNIQKQRIRNK